MKVRIRPSSPNDRPAIVALMRNAGLNPDATERSLHLMVPIQVNT
jgi:hypothetical protein